jgi:hypothetical protein
LSATAVVAGTPQPRAKAALEALANVRLARVRRHRTATARSAAAHSKMVLFSTPT